MKRIALIALVVGLAFFGCDTGDDTNNLQGYQLGNNIQLPEPVGTNELADKTYDNGRLKIVFNGNGMYSLSIGNEIEETGYYSWNTPQNNVFLVAEKISVGESGELLNKQDVLVKYSSPLPPNMTLWQLIEEINYMFSMMTYTYSMEHGEIVSFGVKNSFEDTGETIAGLAYSQKATTDRLGFHYLLTISFDEALTILTAAYGQPQDGWGLQSDSSLTDGIINVVIFEITRFGDFRLHHGYPRITKGWIGIIK